MPKFNLSTTLLASFDVEGDTIEQAKAKLRRALLEHEANFGMLDDEPLIAGVDVEGEIDGEEEG